MYNDNTSEAGVKTPAFFQTVFVSDLHLGTKKSKAKEFVTFLEEVKFNHLVLVGDIIDGWALRRGQKWTKAHTEAIRAILKLSKDIQISYVTGNHDDFIRPFLKYRFAFGNIEFHDRMVYESISGKHILVVHGDQQDFWMKVPKSFVNFLAHFTDFFYQDKPENVGVHRYIRTCSTENTVRRLGKKYDGVICGHTHIPKIYEAYMNCGDWTKKCTFIAEHEDGSFSLENYVSNT